MATPAPVGLIFSRARPADVRELAALHRAVAEDLGRRHGEGHWSRPETEHGVLRRVLLSDVVLARLDAAIVGTLTLQRKKPWAIDRSLLTPGVSYVYMVSMAVAPGRQRTGIGRRLLAEADRAALDAGAGAIALDAYDAPAGAGGFYARCGYREIGRKTYRGVPLIYFERVLIAGSPAASPGEAD